MMSSFGIDASQGVSGVSRVCLSCMGIAAETFIRSHVVYHMQILWL